MPGQRKLFIAHASELAYRCVRAVQRDGLVAEFVRSYAGRYDRPGRSLSPERNREFDSTIGREALLVMAAKVRRMLLAAFGHATGRNRTRPGNARLQLNPEEAALSEGFYAEFLASLGRSLEWSPADAATESEAFRGDLEMYHRWSGRSSAQSVADPSPQSNMKSKLNSAWPPSDRASTVGMDNSRESPFADRCALLLDPAMMEQARGAAAAFEVEISRAAARMFAQLGRRPAPRNRSVRKAQPRGPRNRIAARTIAPSSSRKKKSTRVPKRALRSGRGPRLQKIASSSGRKKLSPAREQSSMPRAAGRKQLLKPQFKTRHKRRLKKSPSS